MVVVNGHSVSLVGTRSRYYDQVDTQGVDFQQQVGARPSSAAR